MTAFHDAALTVAAASSTQFVVVAAGQATTILCARFRAGRPSEEFVQLNVSEPLLEFATGWPVVVSTRYTSNVAV